MKSDYTNILYTAAQRKQRKPMDIVGRLKSKHDAGFNQ